MTGSGICSVAFCESAALQKNGLALSVSLRSPAPPKGEPLAKSEALQFTRKLSRHAIPLGELSPQVTERARTVEFAAAASLPVKMG